MQKISTSKTIATVEIELDGIIRKMKFTNGAMRKFKELTGKNALMLKDEINDYLSEMVLCGLQTFNPDLKLEEVDEMIGPGNMYYVFTKITEAWGVAMPDPEELIESAGETPLT